MSEKKIYKKPALYTTIKRFLYNTKEVLLDSNGAEKKKEDVEKDKLAELITQSHELTDKLYKLYESIK